MTKSSTSRSQIQTVSSFQNLISIPFSGEVNALAWKRNLRGDFEEIVNKIEPGDNLVTLSIEDLKELQLSEQGDLAREVLINDFKALEDLGASPVLNVIQCYDREEPSSFFPTDVYSFHVDRSPVPVDTFLCTYYGASSEIVPNADATKKILIPEIRKELVTLYGGTEDEGFEIFLSENFYDLHYEVKPDAQILSLGTGHIYRLAIEHPESQVLPCVHRAPLERPGQSRLLMIC